MDQYLRRMLIIAVLVSFIFSSSAQNATSTDHEEDSSLDSTRLCHPGTTKCDEQNHDPKPPRQGNTVDSPVENSENEDYDSSSEDRILCDPLTEKCRQPKHVSFVSESGKASQIEDSIIQEKHNGIDPVVCNPNPDGSTTCHDSHHPFGIAQPRDEL